MIWSDLYQINFLLNLKFGFQFKKSASDSFSNVRKDVEHTNTWDKLLARYFYLVSLKGFPARKFDDVIHSAVPCQLEQYE